LYCCSCFVCSAVRRALRTVSHLCTQSAIRHRGTKTASGIPLADDAMTAAHKFLKFGSKVRVTNKANGNSVQSVARGYMAIKMCVRILGEPFRYGVESPDKANVVYAANAGVHPACKNERKTRVLDHGTERVHCGPVIGFL
jgi:hypothetical protein